MTSVNVTTQSNTVTVQQGDATTVTIATQGPQGPAGAGSSDVVDDTSPQLGGDLASNGFDIKFADNDKAVFGTGEDLKILHDSTDSFIENSTGNLHIRSQTGEEAIKLIPNSAVQIYHDNAIAIHTQSWGNQLYGTLQALGDIEPFLASADTTKAIRFKNNTGEALKIIHQSSNSFITNNVGSLFIEAKNGEKGIAIIPDGAVELYFNNVKKAETSADGFQIQDNLTISGDNPKLIFDQTSSNVKYKIEEGSGLLQLKISSNGGVSYASAISIGGVGNIFIPDNDKVNFGSGNDLVIVHDGSDSKITNKTGDLLIEAKDSETGIKVIADGAVELYHDNVKRVETSANGLDMPDNSNLTIGDNQDLQLFHNGTRSEIKNINVNNFTIRQQFAAGFMFIHADQLHLRSHSNNELYMTCLKNGAVALYHDNVKRCETSADGLNLPDNSKLQLGDSQDLQIFHDSANSFIKDSGTGGLIINTDAFQIKDQNNSTFALTAVPTSFVKLFFNNSVKLETTNSGITVTGSVTTQDMNMSNLNGTANEVDNTKGSWSIQEGADDLFLINRVNGKKYKFNLTEVS